MLDSVHKRIRYKCWHRGTKEMDIILGQFFDQNYLSLSHKELLNLEKFVISLPDDTLYNCLLGKTKWPAMVSHVLMKKLNIYRKNIGL